MKKNLFVLMIFLSIALVSCISCENSDQEITSQDEKNREFAKEIVTPKNFDTIIFGNQNNQKAEPVSDFYFTTQSDFINAVGGCYTVNVRVYLHMNNQVTLLTSENVQVGDCGGGNRISGSECTGVLPDGNIITYSDDSNLYCLYELLTKNQEIYNSYRNSIQQLLE